MKKSSELGGSFVSAFFLFVVWVVVCIIYAGVILRAAYLGEVFCREGKPAMVLIYYSVAVVLVVFFIPLASKLRDVLRDAHALVNG
jgi:hypothetical protein